MSTESEKRDLLDKNMEPTGMKETKSVFSLRGQVFHVLTTLQETHTNLSACDDLINHLYKKVKLGSYNSKEFANTAVDCQHQKNGMSQVTIDKLSELQSLSGSIQEMLSLFQEWQLSQQHLSTNHGTGKIDFSNSADTIGNVIREEMQIFKRLLERFEWRGLSEEWKHYFESVIRQNRSLEVQLKNSQTELLAREKKLEELEDQLQKLSHYLDSKNAEAQNTELQRIQIQELETHCAHLTEELQRQRERVESQHLSIQSERESVQLKVHDLQQKIEDMTAELENIEAVKTNLEFDIGEKSKEICHLRSVLEEESKGKIADKEEKQIVKEFPRSMQKKQYVSSSSQTQWKHNKTGDSALNRDITEDKEYKNLRAQFQKYKMMTRKREGKTREEINFLVTKLETVFQTLTKAEQNLLKNVEAKTGFQAQLRYTMVQLAEERALRETLEEVEAGLHAHIFNMRKKMLILNRKYASLKKRYRLVSRQLKAQAEKLHSRNSNIRKLRNALLTLKNLCETLELKYREMLHHLGEHIHVAVQLMSVRTGTNVVEISMPTEQRPGDLALWYSQIEDMAAGLHSQIMNLTTEFVERTPTIPAVTSVHSDRTSRSEDSLPLDEPQALESNQNVIHQKQDSFEDASTAGSLIREQKPRTTELTSTEKELFELLQTRRKCEHQRFKMLLESLQSTISNWEIAKQPKLQLK